MREWALQSGLHACLVLSSYLFRNEASISAALQFIWNSGDKKLRLSVYSLSLQGPMIHSRLEVRVLEGRICDSCPALAHKEQLGDAGTQSEFPSTGIV
jgi:hypothetical protein